MKRPASAKLPLALAAAAAASWAFILARGGLVEHPPRKPDRAARATVPESGARAATGDEVGPASRRGPDLDPAARVAALEARVEALVAARSRFERADAAELDQRLAASLAPVPAARGATDELDPDLAAFLAESPLEGTHVRGALRIASFGGRVLREGDELVPGRARVERIEPGGVLVDCGERRVHLAFAARSAEGSK